MYERERERWKKKVHVKSLPKDKKVYPYIKIFTCPLCIELMYAFMQPWQGGNVPGRKDPILCWILCHLCRGLGSRQGLTVVLLEMRTQGIL